MEATGGTYPSPAPMFKVSYSTSHSTYEKWRLKMAMWLRTVKAGIKIGSTDFVVYAPKWENTTTPWTRSLTWRLT